MARWWDKVEERVYAVVSEARVTLDTRLLGENVIILPFQMSNNFLEAKARWLVPRYGPSPRSNSRKFVVNVVTEAGRVDNGEGDTNAILLELWVCIHR